MAEKDAVAKDYMQDPETFADAFNFFLYGGRQVVKPEKLRPLDPTSIALPYGKDGSPVPIQKYRDVLKIATIMKDDRAAYLLLGVENQSEVHYAMPVRNMAYDSIHYVKQVEAAAKTRGKADKKGETRGEFLSGFRKTDKLIPVVTLTIYFGPDSWNGPKDLHSMMAADEETLRFVPNYRLNLLAPSELSEKDFVKFRTELSLVLKYVKYSKDKRRFAEQIRKDPAFQNVSSKTVDMVNAVAGANIRYKKGEERVNMCEAMEGLLNDARTEGRAEGRAEGREEGIIGEKKATARKLRQKGWTVEEIAEFQDVSPVDVKIWLDSEGE